DQGGWSMFGIFSGGLDHLSPAYHLAVRGNGRAGVPSWLTDAPLEEDQGGWSMFGIFSGGLDHLSPAYHLAVRGNGRAG
ncbi:hypothetical protein CTI14_68980, partial [Methylobacterium radiotolerans]